MTLRSLLVALFAFCLAPVAHAADIGSFDLLGIKLGDDYKAMHKALSDQGFAVDFVSSNIWDIELPNGKAHYTVRAAYEKEGTFVLVKLSAPSVPDMKQVVTGIQVILHADGKFETPATAAWSDSIAGKLIGKWGQPETDVRKDSACGFAVANPWSGAWESETAKAEMSTFDLGCHGNATLTIIQRNADLQLQDDWQKVVRFYANQKPASVPEF